MMDAVIKVGGALLSLGDALPRTIAALEPGLQALSDEALRARTTELRQRLAAGAEVDDDADVAMQRVKTLYERQLVAGA